MANDTSQKRSTRDKRLANLKPIRKGQVLNPWGCKGKDGTITDLITKQARAIAAERVKTESGASTTLLDAAIRKLVQQGLVHGDVQALSVFLDLVRGHKLRADVALSGHDGGPVQVSIASLIDRGKGTSD